MICIDQSKNTCPSKEGLFLWGGCGEVCENVGRLVGEVGCDEWGESEMGCGFEVGMSGGDVGWGGWFFFGGEKSALKLGVYAGGE